MRSARYFTTPIYYVNDAPHIGHIFSTLLADIGARTAQLENQEKFLLTGTDEHSMKVIEAAQARAVPVEAWAQNNADAFRQAFTAFNIDFDDFIRTSEPRHKINVHKRIEQLMATGDIYLGEYIGWYDAGQEEYVPDTKAKQYEYKSPVNKKPLLQRTEKNYFFRLSRYQEQLLALLNTGELKIHPASRTAEIVARVQDGLSDIPISRHSAQAWGINVPGDNSHIVYVWVDALFNYLTAIDTVERRHLWPAALQVVGKDILWFHAVIWPAMLLALKQVEGNQWLDLPRNILAHGFWIREGEKMSKSMGNFIDIKVLQRYCDELGVDSIRFFLASAGPVGASDSDFSHSRLIESYNANLANTVGNCFNRIIGMVNRYFHGVVPDKPDVTSDFYKKINELSIASRDKAQAFQYDKMIALALAIFRTIDQHVNLSEPYKLIKQPENLVHVGHILHDCLEALRHGALALWPVMPDSMGKVLQNLGCLDDVQSPCFDHGRSISPGYRIKETRVLFPRYQEAP
ncbi:methionine--tRNA ligase [Pseudomonas putida]|uniref:Methionine--tRNA ligase n=1 Tax=Pseudomonas putida TaxID=303 RepID=A0A1Y3KIY6_PSEPU|nr:methionine--tRNA ligase [Pseudomonas putida]OUM23960.1 methionine--tRNA ligase [Pseudomonas putida]